jgi:hypothetical protein
MSATTSDALNAPAPLNLKVILLGGLIAGTLDMTAACTTAWLQAGVTPVQVMRYVASGLLGPAALTGGAKIAALGLALHYLIATIWTTIFYVASRRARILVDQPILAGLLYGVVVYLIMNFIVVPLSAVRRGSPTLSSRLIQMSILMVCIGLPISLIVRRFSKPRLT